MEYYKMLHINISARHIYRHTLQYALKTKTKTKLKIFEEEIGFC